MVLIVIQSCPVKNCFDEKEAEWFLGEDWDYGFIAKIQVKGGSWSNVGRFKYQGKYLLCQELSNTIIVLKGLNFYS